MADQSGLHHITHCCGAIKQGIAEEMQAPGYFTFHCGFFNTNFTRHPQQINFIAKLEQQCVALTRSPTWVIEFKEF